MSQTHQKQLHIYPSEALRSRYEDFIFSRLGKGVGIGMPEDVVSMLPGSVVGNFNKPRGHINPVKDRQIQIIRKHRSTYFGNR
jgi:hypothetical protein